MARLPVLVLSGDIYPAFGMLEYTIQRLAERKLASITSQEVQIQTVVQ
jgi:hypothetical protein